MSPSAASKTGALAAGLALSCAGLVVCVPTGPLLASPLTAPPSVQLLVLAGLFLVAELCLLHVEVRRQAYTVTLAGIPIALGLLLCGSRELVAARLVGSLAAFLVQRDAALRLTYNLAAYAFEVALGSAALHLLAGPGHLLSPRLALSCGAVLLAVDQLMTGLVVQVITWHQSRLSLRETAEVHLPALVCTALSASGAYGALLLASHGLVGTLVLGAFVTAEALFYRGFQVLHRRHQALAQVHAFVALNDHESGAEQLAGVMVGQVRELMRAACAELLLDDDAAPLHVLVDDEGESRGPTGRRVGDVPALTRLAPDQALLLHRGTRDKRLRGWLTARGATDAVLVPLAGPDGRTAGSLLVTDRLGGTGSFTREDQTLLATLAGYLTVALSSSRRRDRLRFEATHDVLTGLGSRALLHEAVTRHLASGGGSSAVLLLDLDRFKEVNDTLGHHVGDALLKVVGARLEAALPPAATVVRLGGDEFAVFLPELGEGVEAVEAVARRLAAALAAPAVLPEATVTTRASIGIAVHEVGIAGATGATVPPPSASDLLRHADTAMYAAKEARTGVCRYTCELDRGRAERLALLADLHLALERRDLHVAYQPQLDLREDRVVGVEALVRWEHPLLGPVSPEVFVPLAEADGLVEALTDLVLGEALRQCATWRAAGCELSVAVNLSARSVTDPALPERIGRALVEAGVPATRLVLEVTESAVMDDPDLAIAVLERVAAIGVTVSLDDFGTGYSSLAYLQRLPVQEVKIDRSFITGLSSGQANSLLLARSIIQLGEGLGLRVVAEGVEDAATLDLLRELGCHLAQGYHISRPQSADRLAPLLQAQPSSDRRLRVVG